MTSASLQLARSPAKRNRSAFAATWLALVLAPWAVAREPAESSGIGVEFCVLDGQVLVVRALEGGPAAASGLSTADRILRIDERSVDGLDQDALNDLLTGETGTPVTLAVVATGSSEERLIRITRASFEADPGRILALLEVQSESVLVGCVWSGSSAEQAGLAPGDSIVAIDGQRVTGRTRAEVAATLALLGGPVGSQVLLRVNAQDSQGEHELVVEREVWEGNLSWACGAWTVGAMKRSERFATRYRDANPDDVCGYLVCALAYEGLGQLEAASREAWEVEERLRDNCVTHRLLARIYAARGVTDEAHAKYLKALALNPRIDDLHLGLAGTAQSLRMSSLAAFHLAEYEARKPESPRPATIRGLWAIDAGDCAQAIRHFDQALEKQPGVALAHRKRGDCYRILGRFDAAVADLERAEALEPGNPRTLFALGSACVGARRDERAVEILTRIVEQDAANLPATLQRGLAAYRSGRLELAAADLERCREARFGGYLTRGLLGLLHAEGGEQSDAREAFTRAARGACGAELDPIATALESVIARKPDDALLAELAPQLRHAREAAALVAQASTAESASERLAALDEVLTMAPEYLPALILRGELVSLEGARLTEALADLDRALVLEPESMEAWLARGNACMREGEHELALASFQELTRVAPDSWTGYEGIGLVHFERGEHEAAIAAFDAALERDPTLRRAGLSKAKSLELLGRHADAMTAYGSYLERNVDDDEALFSWAYCAFETRDYFHAEDGYFRLTQRNPRHVAATYNHALALHKLGYYERAVAVMEQARQLDSDLPVVDVSDPSPDVPEPVAWSEPEPETEAGVAEVAKELKTCFLCRGKGAKQVEEWSFSLSESAYDRYRSSVTGTRQTTGGSWESRKVWEPCVVCRGTGYQP